MFSHDRLILLVPAPNVADVRPKIRNDRVAESNVKESSLDIDLCPQRRTLDRLTEVRCEEMLRQSGEAAQHIYTPTFTGA